MPTAADHPLAVLQFGERLTVGSRYFGDDALTARRARDDNAALGITAARVADGVDLKSRRTFVAFDQYGHRCSRRIGLCLHIEGARRGGRRLARQYRGMML